MRFLAGFLMPLMAIPLINYTADVYFILQPDRLASSAHTNQSRLKQATAIRSLQPTALVLGASNVRNLFPHKQDDSEGHFHAATLNSGKMYEIWKYFEFAHTTGNVEHVVIGLNLSMFVGESTAQDYNEQRLSPLTWIYTPKMMQDYFYLFFSREATRASLTKMFKQMLGREIYRPPPAIMRIQERIRCASSETIPAQNARTLIPRPVLLRFHMSLNYLQQLVHVAHQNNIELTLLIPPAHSVTMLFPSAPYYPELYELWKHQLVILLEQASAEYPGTQPFPLWDFTGFNSITTEHVPAEADASFSMQWFGDAVHLKNETSQLIRHRILDHDTANIPSDFGVLLTQKNIDKHLANLREQEATFHRMHPERISDWYVLYERKCGAPAPRIHR